MRRKIAGIILLCLVFMVVGFTLTPGSNSTSGDYDFLMKRIKDTKSFTIEVFEAMPAKNFSYKPNEEVRSYGAQAFHIAYTIEWFIPKMMGRPIKWEPGDEDRLSKTALIDYADTQFEKLISFVNGAKESPQLTDEIINFLNHNAHHRGQMTTYLRMQGIKPPDYR